MDALLLCQHAIANASVNPATAKVPYVPSSDAGDSWNFLWREDSGAQLQNGLGVMVGAYVFCKVDKSTHQIRTLAIDGTIIR